MTIIYSSRQSSENKQLQNLRVNKALQEWERRVEAARLEGIEIGKQEVAEQLQEAQAIQQSVDEKIQRIQEEADLKIKQRFQDWQSDWGRVLASLQEAMDEVTHIEQQAVQSAEHSVVQLALNMAGHILHKQIDEDPQWMLAMVQSAIQQMPNKRAIHIRLHPTDAEQLEQQRQAIGSDIQQALKFEVIADDQLSRGSLILESNGTHIDAGLQFSWERLQEHMLALTPSVDWKSTAIVGPDTLQDMTDRHEENSEPLDAATEESEASEDVAAEQTQHDVDIANEQVEEEDNDSEP